MDDSLNAPSSSEPRVMPRWVRIGIWVAIAFLTLSVISGMFLYWVGGIGGLFMIDLVAETLSYSVGVAISPVPIAAVIVMLFTPRAKTNAPSFAVGWVAGLLVVGYGAWRKRPQHGVAAEAPKWMNAIDQFGIGKSIGMGFALSAINPKNLLLVVAAAATISSSSASTGEQVGALLIFVAIAATTVVVPVVGYLIVGERADDAFERARDWLIQNNSVVMAVLLLVFGVSLIADAIEILF